jgi:hypothetical protein
VLSSLSGRFLFPPNWICLWTVAVFRVRESSRSNGRNQMIRDLLSEIFGIHEELDGGGEPVLVTLAPPIRNRISCGTVLSTW